MADPRPRLLLDTNVLLDALVFDDPATRPWLDALRRGAIVALASPAIEREWRNVLARPLDAKWEPARERALTSWPPFALEAAADPAPATGAAPRCDDPDDQKFIDLALAARPRWLLTRDRALLRLAKAAHRFGVLVLRPADGRPEPAADAAESAWK
jgi:uncharacterized protein